MNAAKLSDNRLGALFDRLFARHIERKGLSRSASGSDLSRHLGQLVDVSCGQCNRRSGLGQLQRAGAPNSLRCSGNQCDTTSENAHEPPYVGC